MTGYSESDLRRAAAAAVRAPSLHNSQPWRFRLAGGAIEVLADPERRLAVADSGGWAVRIACGAATFNARLALATAGTPAEVVLRPHDAGPEGMARLTPAAPRPPTYAERDLHAAIPRRHSNRQPFWPHPVPSEIRARLIEAARAEGAWLDLLVGMTALAGFAELATSADRAPAPEPQDLLPQRSFGDRPRATGRDFEPEPLVAVLGSGADRPIDQIQAGQALQRVLLTATDAGLAGSMMSQPIEVPAARDQLRRSLRRPGPPQMALRIGYGHPGRPTARRPLDEVLCL
jgi:nitroreductase